MCTGCMCARAFWFARAHARVSLFLCGVRARVRVRLRMRQLPRFLPASCSKRKWLSHHHLHELALELGLVSPVEVRAVLFGFCSEGVELRGKEQSLSQEFWSKASARPHRRLSQNLLANILRVCFETTGYIAFAS